MTENERPAVVDRVAGQRVVVTVYLAVVAVAGLMGLFLGVVNPEGMDPELFFLVDLPANALGMALFGITTVGSALGVFLLAVGYVSRYDADRVE